MLEMDGCEAARRSGAGADAETVPIVAVTANAFPEGSAAASVAGMDAHISKPVDFGQLCQVLKAGRRPEKGITQKKTG